MSMKSGLLDVSMLQGSSVETKQACRWRELPRVSFLSRVATKVYLPRQNDMCRD